MARVLVIEDDDAIRSSLVRDLRAARPVVTPAETGLAGLNAMVVARPEVIILDLGLPALDVSDVHNMIRAVSEGPVIVATARDDDSSIVRLLES